MDKELQQLEAELKRLRPVAVPAALVRRVGEELATPQPQERALAPVHRIWAAAVTMAAAAVVMMLQPRAPTAPRSPRVAVEPPASGLLKPVAVENVLVAAQEEGFVTLEDGTPARRARLKYVDTITWKNPRTNASMTWTVPREEVRIVPVSFQ